jgi:hypothetical protein
MTKVKMLSLTEFVEMPPKKKKIEVIGCVVNDGESINCGNEPNQSFSKDVSRFQSIECLPRIEGYDVDLMICTDQYGCKLICTGHFNDGIV